jgi:hypothetical protein
MRTLALAVLVLVAGCATPPEIEIPHDRTVVVIPFGGLGDAPFTSATGDAVAEAVERTLEKKADFNVVEVPLEVYKGPNPSALSAVDLARIAHADYALSGSVTNWDTQGAIPNFPRGEAALAIELWDARTGKRFAKRRVTAHFPKDREFIVEDPIEPGLEKACADAVAALFLSSRP